MSQESQESQPMSDDVSRCQTETQRGLSRAASKPRKRGKNAAQDRGAPAPTTPTATEAPRAVLVEAEPLNAMEREVLRMVNVNRADPHEVAEVLNLAQQTNAYTVEGVGRILERARAKLVRAGEAEAARPNAYVVEDTRLRYDALVKSLRAELALLGAEPSLTMLRVKLLKTIADVEAMRDAALQAIAPLPGSLPAGGALVYVSRLRSGPAR